MWSTIDIVLPFFLSAKALRALEATRQAARKSDDDAKAKSLIFLQGRGSHQCVKFYSLFDPVNRSSKSQTKAEKEWMVS